MVFITPSVGTRNFASYQEFGEPLSALSFHVFSPERYLQLSVYRVVYHT